MGKTKISGIGYYVPEKILDNAYMESIVDTTDEWITTRTGIKERHVLADDQASSDMAIASSEIAIKDAGIDKKDIGLLVLATTTPDRLLPSTACIVATKLGLSCPAFDMYAACSGLVYGMNIAEQYIINNTCKHVLVVASESLTRFVNWTDRATCVLFGDASTSFIVSPKENDDDKNESEILSTYINSDGNFAEILDIPAGGSRTPASVETVEKHMHAIHMDGQALFKIAVDKMKSGLEIACEKANIGLTDLDLLIPHQANIRIIKSVGRYTKLPPEKVLINIDRYGNTSSASMGIGLCEAVYSGRIKRGDIVGMTAFGGGLTWAASVIRY